MPQIIIRRSDEEIKMFRDLAEVLQNAGYLLIKDDRTADENGVVAIRFSGFPLILGNYHLAARHPSVMYDATVTQYDPERNSESSAPLREYRICVGVCMESPIDVKETLLPIQRVSLEIVVRCGTVDGTKHGRDVWLTTNGDITKATETIPKVILGAYGLLEPHGIRKYLGK